MSVLCNVPLCFSTQVSCQDGVLCYFLVKYHFVPFVFNVMEIYINELKYDL